MNKSALRQAFFHTCRVINNAELSFQSKHDYKSILHRALKQLNERGFILRDIDQLKQKHIAFLIDEWKNEQLSAGTIKNRVSALRKVAELTGRKDVVKSNEAYALEKREYIPSVSKGIHDIDLQKIDDLYIRASLELQKEFGLRREESLKFKPHQADKGLFIELQASWTKGGIQRVIPLTNTAQRECLDRIKTWIGKDNSLIPKEDTYKTQRNLYDNLTRKHELNNLHGLRHAYAQRRYVAITNKLTKGHGWQSPIQGGPTRKSLNSFEKMIDRDARQMISQELGHSRIAITKSYLG